MSFSSCEILLFLKNLLLRTQLPKSLIRISRVLCFLFMINKIWASSMYLIFPLVPMATLYCVASSRFCCTRFPLRGLAAAALALSPLPPTQSFLSSPERGSLDHINQSGTECTANKVCLSCHVN